MEPWTENTRVLDTEVAGVAGTLESFPEDGSEWTTGVFGRALLFDGLDRHVAHDAPLPRTEGTIGHWLRPSTASGTRVALYESDFAGAGSPDYNGFGSAGAALEIHTGIFDGDYYAIWQDGLNQRDVRGGTVNAGEWAHVALTWSIPGQMKLYVNCVEVDSVAMDVAFDGRSPTEHFLGKPSQFNGRHWPGAIDEVKVWDREFTAEGIRSHFCPVIRSETDVIRAQTPTEGDRFGDSIALDGDWLLVRSPGASEVSWFRRQGASALQLHSSRASTFDNLLAPSLPAAKPLDVAGPIAAIANAEGVDVYALDESGPATWTLATSLAEPSAENFGFAVAASGDRIAVGAPTSDGGGIFVFERDQGGTGAWGATFSDMPGSFSSDEFYGRLVDLDGDLLAVSRQSVSLSSTTDFVDLYRRGEVGGTAGWGQEGEFFADGNSIMSLAVRGDRIATGVSNPDGDGQGNVLVRSRNQGGSNAWGIEHVFVASDADSFDRLGANVVWLDDQTLAAVALGTDEDHQAIYVFRVGGPFLKKQDTIYVPRTFDPITEFRALVGTSLAGAKNLVLAGAPLTGFALTQLPVQPGFSGRIHAFVPIEIFSDGFESDGI